MSIMRRIRPSETRPAANLARLSLVRLGALLPEAKNEPSTNAAKIKSVAHFSYRAWSETISVSLLHLVESKIRSIARRHRLLPESVGSGRLTRAGRPLPALRLTRGPVSRRTVLHSVLEFYGLHTNVARSRLGSCTGGRDWSLR